MSARFSALLGSLAAASSATISVSPGAGTLQTALYAASAGDELLLEAGEYTGTVAYHSFTVNKSIVIRAQTPGTAVLKGNGWSDGMVSPDGNGKRVIMIESTGASMDEGVVFDGVVITEGAPRRDHSECGDQAGGQACGGAMVVKSTPYVNLTIMNSVINSSWCAQRESNSPPH